MSEILAYLENVMEHQAMIRRKNQVLKSMLYAENLQVYFYTLFDLKARTFIHIFECLSVWNFTYRNKKHILNLFIPSLQWWVMSSQE